MNVRRGRRPSGAEDRRPNRPQTGGSASTGRFARDHHFWGDRQSVCQGGDLAAWDRGPDDRSGGWARAAKRVPAGAYWGRNLDAFNDILRGGFGTPEEGFVIRWINSDQAREHLGYGETVKRFEEMFWECHPENKDHVYGMLTEARAGKGETVFDQLIEIIRTHGPGGEEADDNVHLALL
ncbi:MAG: barstar family protein [Pseudomonadota bacterium]|uniref:barstar family protein n=1 Tax=Phenylobacterium sp. TaxID=1871053 RepID=UPI0025E74BE8|nr:barstar family protein [Phenylobacterium sp.]MBT9471799.1 barstar family protein [Phenylobacterium sp.]